MVLIFNLGFHRGLFQRAFHMFFNSEFTWLHISLVKYKNWLLDCRCCTSFYSYPFPLYLSLSLSFFLKDDNFTLKVLTLIRYVLWHNCCRCCCFGLYLVNFSLVHLLLIRYHLNVTQSFLMCFSFTLYFVHFLSLNFFITFNWFQFYFICFSFAVCWILFLFWF